MISKVPSNLNLSLIPLMILFLSCWCEISNLSPLSFSAQMKLVKGLQPLEFPEKGTVTFSVEVSHEDVEGTWQKDGVRLKPAPNITMGAQGKKEDDLEDAGLISFEAEGINSSGRLTVTGIGWCKV